MASPALGAVLPPLLMAVTMRAVMVSWVAWAEAAAAEAAEAAAAPAIAVGDVLVKMSGARRSLPFMARRALAAAAAFPSSKSCGYVVVAERRQQQKA